MAMHVPPTIDTGTDRIATMFPRISPIMNSLSPATQIDILGILQREQDRAVALLSSSPLLASLFVSYANQAAALESASATSPTESDEWKALETTITALQEEIDKLKPENIKMAEKLEAGTASLEAFRSQVASLKEANTTHQREIHSLSAELIESKDKYDHLLEDSDAERDSLLNRVSDLEIQRTDLKETVVEQQLKISKLERQSITAKEEKEKIEQETKGSGHHETRRDQKSSAPTILSAWGSNVEKDEPPKKVSSFSRKEQKGERGGGRGVGPTEKGKASALPPVNPSSVPVGPPGGVELASFAKKGPSGGAVEVRLPPEEEKDSSDFSVVSSPITPSRVAVYSENERLTDEEPPSPLQSPRPTLVQHPVPEAPLDSTTESVGVSRAVKEEAPTTPKPCPTPCLARSPAPAHTSTKDEPEKPFSLRERNKIATPTPTEPGDRQPTFTDTVPDQKRENRRANPVEGLPGSSVRRRNDSAHSQVTAKPAPRPAPASKVSGWGTWGGSLLRNIADDRERSPSPEPAVVKPKGNSSGPTRNQPQPKSQSAGVGLSNKPVRSSTLGDVKDVSTPRTQRVSSGTAAWFKSISENVQTNLPEGSGSGDISGSAVEVRHVPAPGLFRGSITDEARET